jgi:steroid delta-isomerase-like uncharacterized protein
MSVQERAASGAATLTALEGTPAVQRYFDAWNRRDPDLVVASFCDDGTYGDPGTPGALAGAAIGTYAAGLFAAFPDLSFEVAGAYPSGDERVVVEWLMGGTNTGSMAGNPPTGRAVSLPGVDVIETSGDRVRSVRGYFDRRTLAEQLGLQVIVQPTSVGPVSFGNSVRLSTGKRTKPGAFSVTWLEAPTEAERDEVRKRTRAMFGELAKMPGFIGLVLAAVGERMMTLSAWESPDDPRQLMRDGLHGEAVDWFFGQSGCSSGWTSVWTVARWNALWVRCPGCGTLAGYDQNDGTCQCGASLPEAPPYW